MLTLVANFLLRELDTQLAGGTTVMQHATLNNLNGVCSVQLK